MNSCNSPLKLIIRLWLCIVISCTSAACILAAQEDSETPSEKTGDKVSGAESFSELSSPTLQLRAVQQKLDKASSSAETSNKTSDDVRVLTEIANLLQLVIDLRSEVSELSEEKQSSELPLPTEASWFEIQRINKILELARSKREKTLDGLMASTENDVQSKVMQWQSYRQRLYVQVLELLQKRDKQLAEFLLQLQKKKTASLKKDVAGVSQALKELQAAIEASGQSQTKVTSATTTLYGLETLVDRQVSLVEDVSDSDDADQAELSERQESAADEIEQLAELVEQQVDVADPMLWKFDKTQESSLAIQSLAALQASSDLLEKVIEKPEEKLSILSTIKDWFWKAIPNEVGDGDTVSVPLPKALALLVALAVASFVALKISDKIREHLLPRLGVKSGQALAIRAIIRYVLFFLFAVVAFRLLEIPLEAFAFVGGAVAIAVGFGSQDIMNNFISGVIMLFEQPIRIGDVVLYQDSPCKVTHIGLRSTRMRHPLNHEITVPNTMLIERPVINMTLTETAVRTLVTLEVDRGEPLEQALEAITTTVQSLTCILQKPAPIVALKQADTYYLVFEVHFYVEGSDPMIAVQVQSQVLIAISRLFPMKKEDEAENDQVNGTAEGSEGADEKARSDDSGSKTTTNGKAMSAKQIHREIARLQAMARTAK